MRALCFACAAVLVIVPTVACAQSGVESPDMQAARNHYEQGRTLYQAKRFPEACEEFVTARRILALAALDYNLAKCEERLEHWSRAVSFYELYLAEAQATEDTAPVVARVGELKARVSLLDSKGQRKLHIAAIAVGAGALVLAGAATGAYLSEWRAYSDQHSSCHGQCAPASETGLSRGVDRAKDAGYALWGIAGAAAVVDVVLWALDTRARQRESATSRVLGVVTW